VREAVVSFVEVPRPGNKQSNMKPLGAYRKRHLIDSEEQNASDCGLGIIVILASP